MILGFTEQTKPLSGLERTALQPAVDYLATRTGRKNKVTNTGIAQYLNTSLQIRLSSPRVRKVLNHIRVNKMVRNLIADSKGYHVSSDPVEISNYKKSLAQRISAQTAVLQSFD